MDILIVLIFISVMLVVGAVVFLAKGVQQGDYDHGDRLSLLPLEDDDGRPAPRGGDAADPGAGPENTA